MASYRKRENGWEYRINYYDSTGKRKPKSKGGFRTKSEAIKAAAEAVHEGYSQNQYYYNTKKAPAKC